ncbi:hypothetical protein OPT61_g5275 [Boeremia exigua]|uniref:Uncharacterized protein n=1 Tax=Boeremia exigua TaxID=749465 RepID=A0ACC2IAW3_9PLEO|nr:hypothetical protein OPT61_g5275 [Boeremia exigua]
MPSLPMSAATPPVVITSNHTLNGNKYREVAYHLDGQNRYVAQSYDVRPFPQHSSPAHLPCTQRLLPIEYSSVRQSDTAARASPSTTTSKKPMVIVQSRGCVLQDKPHAKKTKVAECSRPIPPPTPRPRLLSSPELSDVEDDRPFCYCDASKNCVYASCRRALR